MRNVSKKIFLNALTCHTLGWLARSELSPKAPTLSERFQIEQGIQIGRRARELYSQGVLVDGGDVVSALQKTESLIDNPNVSVIFEGTFVVDGFTTRADILKRKGDGWRLTEVKSSVNDKGEFIDDMAYTAMVINRSGLELSGASLLLISKDFRLGMENDALFVEIDHTDEVMDRVKEFNPLWEEIEETTRESVKPEPETRFECRSCELFKECVGKGIENHIFEIPRLSQSKFAKLRELGIVCIEDVPGDFPLTEKQSVVKDCVQLKEPFIGAGLKAELGAISMPAYYLDFETVMTAIPLYPNIAPYTQIPTQYSIHKCSELGSAIGHSDYLADPSRDCRRRLAEKLINDLGEEGSIIVYTSFEKGIIGGLARIYHELSEQLGLLIDRLVDLEAIIRKNFWHPEFRGRTSIKRTLPALAPEMAYDDLDIAEGGSAMAAFAYMALGAYDESEAESMKRDLLEYCKQDTLAMVKLHERLAEAAGWPSG